MSRQPPFPTNASGRARTPPNHDTNNSRNTTLPLSINRQSARPMTPSSSTSSVNARQTPSRPARSDRRQRHGSQFSISSIPTPDPDPNGARGSYEQRQELDNMSNEPEQSPKALKAVLNAFQQAGAQRKRAMTNGTLEREKERERELQEENRRQRQIRDKIPGRRTNGRQKAVGSIDAVLDRIEDGWAFVVDPDFNPVDLALQLLESSSDRDMDSFRYTKNTLAGALKGSVDKHYQAFAAALPHHASVLNHLTVTQTQISDARVALQEAKDALGSRRSDLVQLSNRRQTIDEMLTLLGEIELLRTVPDSLESLISEKRLLNAATLLMKSLKTIRKSELLEIGAISDLRSYLIGQETALRDILIDEIQSHIFLKSFWCECRWSTYTPNQQSLSEVQYDKGVPSAPEHSPSLSESDCPPRLRKFLNDLATRPNDSPTDPNERGASVGYSTTSEEDTRIQNPESDSFTYLETLLESLAVLGKLGSALDVISQRLPTEIYSLVENTIEEVHERAEVGKRSTFYAMGVQSRASSIYVFVGDSETDLAQSLADASNLRLAALESMEKQVDHEILRDFFWTLYSKLDAVTQGLRVVYEISNRIGSRRDFKDSSGAKLGALFPLNDIWSPIQSEVRTLLSDYLSDEDKGVTSGRTPLSSINEILRESRFSRDRGKQGFRFADTDVKMTTRSLRTHEAELNGILHDTVPGLVQGASENTAQSILSHVGTDDRLLSAEHHRLLIRSDAFHVSILFQPTLSFLERVSGVLPSGTELIRASTELLDDFVINVYLPQLEEKSSLLFHNIVTGHDAFLIDPASLKLTREPLLKACTQLMALINSLCAMLRATPFHRESYSRLILSVIIQFYQRCSDRFQGVVSRSNLDLTESRMLMAAQWAQREDLAGLSTKQLSMDGDENKKLRLYNDETRIELGLVGDSTINKTDLLSSSHDLSFLASLYTSLAWLIGRLKQLKSDDDSKKVDNITSPTSPAIPRILDPNQKLQLPLTGEMAIRYESLIRTYEQLAQILLFTIRLDMRCRIIYFLGSAMRHGNYRIDQEDSEPDPHVIDMNIELGKADEDLSVTLPEKERLFVFEGFDLLMEEILISNSRFIRYANTHGVRKIQRNIVALRQNVKTLSSWRPKTDFGRAREFYGLFSTGPEGLLETAKKERKFKFDEYKSMLNLQCGVDQTLSSTAAQPADRNYNMYIIELHGLELEQATTD